MNKILNNWEKQAKSNQRAEKCIFCCCYFVELFVFENLSDEWITLTEGCNEICAVIIKQSAILDVFKSLITMEISQKNKLI